MTREPHWVQGRRFVVVIRPLGAALFGGKIHQRREIVKKKRERLALRQGPPTTAFEGRQDKLIAFSCKGGRDDLPNTFLLALT